LEIKEDEQLKIFPLIYSTSSIKRIVIIRRTWCIIITKPADIKKLPSYNFSNGTGQKINAFSIIIFWYQWQQKS
jgi:hypothetical protein